MRKIKMMILMLALSLIFVFIPSSKLNAASNKTQVKNVVNKYFKYAKKLNLKMGAYYWPQPSDDDDTEPLDFNNSLFKFYRKQNKKYFKHNIKSVKINGNTAVVKVKVRYQSYKKATIAACIDTTWVMMVKDLSYNQMLKYIYKYLKVEAKKNKPKKVNKTITIKLKKKNNIWKINKFSNTIFDPVTCDFLTALDMFAKALE